MSSHHHAPRATRTRERLGVAVVVVVVAAVTASGLIAVIDEPADVTAGSSRPVVTHPDRGARDGAPHGPDGLDAPDPSGASAHDSGIVAAIERARHRDVAAAPTETADATDAAVDPSEDDRPATEGFGVGDPHAIPDGGVERAADQLIDIGVTDTAPTTGPRTAVGRFDGEERVGLVPTADRLHAFRGLSTWIDLYDVEISPEEQVAWAHAVGVEAIFTQTAWSRSEVDLEDPARLGRLLDAAAAADIAVMTWYFADFEDVELDLRRAQVAIAFTSPGGHRADAFGLDIESEKVADVTVRTANLLAISARLRAWVGPDYPLAAIVLPPLQLDLRPSWWPAFPWPEIAHLYDVVVPMSYSSYRGTDPQTTYDWNHANVAQLRARTGVADLSIHLAGGIADNLPHVDALVDALRDAGVVGGGLYDLDTTPDEAWRALRRLRHSD